MKFSENVNEARKRGLNFGDVLESETMHSKSHWSDVGKGLAVLSQGFSIYFNCILIVFINLNYFILFYLFHSFIHLLIGKNPND